MGQQSWEHYQQPETGPGIAYPLWWICGLSTTEGDLVPTATLAGNTLYAIPFDQIRLVTVSKMIISLSTQGGADAKCRLGIYVNAADNNNKPSELIVDAGELDISNTSALGARQITGLNTILPTDTRYWAVLLTNADGANAQITGLAFRHGIFWGARDKGGIVGFQPVTGLVLSHQTYGPLPVNFPAVSNANLVDTMMPAIALAFSSVT